MSGFIFTPIQTSGMTVASPNVGALSRGKHVVSQRPYTFIDERSDPPITNIAPVCWWRAAARIAHASSPTPRISMRSAGAVIS